MMTTQTILFGVASQTLVFDCPQGVPSEASVMVFEDSDGDTGSPELATTGAVSIDSLATTFDSPSGYSEADPTKLHLTATTDIEVGRTYLVANAHGQRELIEVDRIDVGAAVYSKTPLLHDYDVADTFMGARVSVVVDTSWASVAGNVSDPLCPRPRYRAIWSYVVDAQTYRVAAYFDLVRYPLTHSVTALDVDRLSRGWLSRLATEDRGNPDDVIAEALYQVKLDLWERSLTAYAQRNSETLGELIRRKAVALVHEQAFQHGGLNRAVLDYSTKIYWDRIDALVPKSAQQTTPDGAASTVPAKKAWRR